MLTRIGDETDESAGSPEPDSDPVPKWTTVTPDEPLLSDLVEIAKQAGRIAQEARTSGHELKPDGSIVTPGDREVEKFLRPELTRLVPGSTVWGEEFGHDGDSPAGLWLVDPIDGTSNYAFGSPLWGVSIALIQSSTLTLGIVNLPDLSELYACDLHRQPTCNDEPLPPMPPGPIRREHLVSYSDNLLVGFPDIDWPGKMRYTGAFVVDAMWVARQRFRALIGVRGKLYDIAASLLICGRLGAQIAYADGTALDFQELKMGQTIPKPYAILPPGCPSPMC